MSKEIEPGMYTAERSEEERRAIFTLESHRVPDVSASEPTEVDVSESDSSQDE